MIRNKLIAATLSRDSQALEAIMNENGGVFEEYCAAVTAIVVGGSPELHPLFAAASLGDRHYGLFAAIYERLDWSAPLAREALSAIFMALVARAPSGPMDLIFRAFVGFGIQIPRGAVETYIRANNPRPAAPTLRLFIAMGADLAGAVEAACRFGNVLLVKHLLAHGAPDPDFERGAQIADVATRIRTAGRVFWRPAPRRTNAAPGTVSVS